MKKFNSFEKVFFISITISLLAVGCNSAVKPAQTTSTPNTPAAVQEQIAPKSEVISYQGQDGKTALDILKATYKVETQNYSGIGEFVKSINGITPDKDHFWGFYVNGTSSNVGASQYQSKSTDKIEWKLDAITTDSK